MHGSFATAVVGELLAPPAPATVVEVVRFAAFAVVPLSELHAATRVITASIASKVRSTFRARSSLEQCNLRVQWDVSGERSEP